MTDLHEERPFHLTGPIIIVAVLGHGREAPGEHSLAPHPPDSHSNLKITRLQTGTFPVHLNVHQNSPAKVAV